MYWIAIKYIDSSSTYRLKYQEQMRGIQSLGRCVRVISVIAIQYIDLSSTYLLKYQTHMRGNQ